MDGWIDGWMDGWKDECMDGRMKFYFESPALWPKLLFPEGCFLCHGCLLPLVQPACSIHFRLWRDYNMFAIA